MQQCHSDRLGHLPLFPDSIPASREKSDQKGLSGAKGAQRTVQGAWQSPGRRAWRGHCSWRRLQPLSALLPPISQSPRAHPASLSSSSRKLCTALRLWVEGKEGLSEEAAHHPCCMWQSLQCSFLAFHTSSSALATLLTSRTCHSDCLSCRRLSA